MAVIELSGKKSRGHFTIVDDEDLSLVSMTTWNYHPQGYAVRSGKRLHRVIMNAPDGIGVDHINGDRLDNRKCNLRLATQTQNNRNSRPQKTTSEYKGVRIDGVGMDGKIRWRASIATSGKVIQLGTFTSEVDAALAYNAAARHFFGEFAWLNKVDGVEPTFEEVIKAKRPRGAQKGHPPYGNARRRATP